MWPDLVKFENFEKMSKVFGNSLKVNLVIGKMLLLLWQKTNAIGQIFVTVNGQILRIDLAIWSHWVTSNQMPLKNA